MKGCCRPEVVQHKALAVVEADAEVPLLPIDMVAIHCKAGAFWLNHIEWLHPAANPNLSQGVLVHKVAAHLRDLRHLQSIDVQVRF